MMRSRIASAIVGSPTMSYQLEDGYCDVMMTDFRSCLSSIISSSMGRSLASSGTINKSSRMSSWQRSIFLSSASSVPLLWRLSAHRAVSEHWHRRYGIPFACFVSKGTGQIAFPVPEEPVIKGSVPYAQNQGWRDVPSDCGPVPGSWHSQSAQYKPCSGMPHFGEPCNGSLGAIVPFACKEHGKERVRSHGLRSGAGKTFPESLCHTMQFHTVH